MLQPTQPPLLGNANHSSGMSAHFVLLSFSPHASLSITINPLARRPPGSLASAALHHSIQEKRIAQHFDWMSHYRCQKEDWNTDLG
ncbi:unnamed protein product [Pleuronectes platessa]|uniref:Uncharacterized protein n=1 Tax=Pleuronectes platessa TaxID=8262 RepID=A0A9N7VDT7_PLEPL|nr:unnamed protein product [Pleuronectes platessa]